MCSFLKAFIYYLNLKKKKKNIRFQMSRLKKKTIYYTYSLVDDNLWNMMLLE